MHPDYAHRGSVESRVIEECSELTKDICKALRFGWDDFNPHTPERTNRMNALGEIADVRRVIDELKIYLNTPTALAPPAVCRWTWDEWKMLVNPPPAPATEEAWQKQIAEWRIEYTMQANRAVTIEGFLAARLVELCISPPQTPAPPAVCRWTYDDICDYYNTECGEAWTLIDGTPKDNGVRFCHGCGKPIEEVKGANDEH